MACSAAAAARHSRQRPNGVAGGAPHRAHEVRAGRGGCLRRMVSGVSQGTAGIGGGGHAALPPSALRAASRRAVPRRCAVRPRRDRPWDAGCPHAGRRESGTSRGTPGRQGRGCASGGISRLLRMVSQLRSAPGVRLARAIGALVGIVSGTGAPAALVCAPKRGRCASADGAPDVGDEGGAFACLDLGVHHGHVRPHAGTLPDLFPDELRLSLRDRGQRRPAPGEGCCRREIFLFLLSSVRVRWSDRWRSGCRIVPIQPSERSVVR